MKTLMTTGVATFLAALSFAAWAMDAIPESAQTGYIPSIEIIPIAVAPWCGDPDRQSYDFNGEQQTILAGESIAWSCKNMFGVAALVHSKDGHGVRVESEFRVYTQNGDEAGEIKQIHQICDSMGAVLSVPSERHIKCESKMLTMDVEWLVWDGTNQIEIDVKFIGAWQQ